MHAFKPFRIGRIEIEFPVVLAALAGYSDLPYRLICRSCGAATPRRKPCWTGRSRSRSGAAAR